MEDFDAIVVGAGPAGCMAAKVLKEGGCNFILIEKFANPKKVCGGLLCEEAIEFLESLNLAHPPNSIPNNFGNKGFGQRD